MHCLVLGITQSGKTTLAKRLAVDYRRRGFGVLVLDPLDDRGWVCDYRTDDPEKFLPVFWRARKCGVFIDEAGDVVGQYNKEMQKTATKGRHCGHSVHFLAQRGAQIAPNVRYNCERLVLFATSKKDAELHAEEWNKPELSRAYMLPQGHYLTCTRFSSIKLGKLWK